MDVHSVVVRSHNMASIRSGDTKPEMIVRRFLHQLGYRYRLHRRDLPGCPDIVFPGRKMVLFVHGCFWHCHDCRYFKWPEANADFWIKKIKSNIERDRLSEIALHALGWQTLTVWECELRNSVATEGKLSQIVDFLTSSVN